MSDAITLLQRSKEAGNKIVGLYCAYAPMELVLAAGAQGFSLCASQEEPIADGEKVLPRNLCPMIKSSYGLAATGKCPFFLYSDLVIGETTCDGKKKMFELLGNLKPVHIMNLPQGYATAADRAYWLASVEELKLFLEHELAVEITEEKLRKAICILNTERVLMQKLATFMKNDPVPLSGQDLLKLMWGRNFVFDRAEFADQIREMIEYVQEKLSTGDVAFPKGAKRILVTGVPTGLGSDKVIRLIEECGAAVVYIESCSGMKQYVTLVDETKPPLEAIAEKYLRTPCSCMSPNPIRLEGFMPVIEEYRIDGVVDVIWQACHTYNVESRVLKEYLATKTKIPFLKIETDFSQNDVEQIRTRVQAFLEMMD